MKNILVSGASGIVGYGILRSLRSSALKLNLIGTTIYADSVAQAFCDSFEQAPKTNAPEYIDWVLRIIKKHRVDLLIPGIEADMYEWNRHQDSIEATGAKVVINNSSLIDLCLDKWVFYQALMDNNSLFAIESSLSSDFNELVTRFKLPFILKPRQGFGSKGIVRVNDEGTFMQHAQKMSSSLMAQPIVGTDDEEYTTSAFGDGQGGFYCHMTLRRKLSIEGFTEKAEVVELDGIVEALGTLCGYFKPLGPTNFQFRVQNGQLKLLEINPRISSSTSIRSSFGYNESELCVNFYLNQKKPNQPVIKKGRAVRYMEDHIFYT